VTSTVNVLAATLEGVPEMMPVELAKLAQLGSEPLETLQVYGDVPLVAPRATAYASPTLALDRLVVSITGGVPPLGAKISTATAP
jgi:hypothetical protein